MDLLFQDFRYGLRMLVKQRATTALAVLLLGLGVGANSAIFSLVDSLLFRSLPGIERADRLVAMFTGGDGAASVNSYMDYRDFAERATSFAALACYKPLERDLMGGGVTDRVQGLIVTQQFFRTVGVMPALGRFFLPEEDETPNSVAVAVLGYELWQNRFGGERSILGESVQLNGRSFEVVGIAPKGFRGVNLASRPQIYTPMMMQPHFMPTYGNLLDRRGWGGTLVVGRLSDRVTFAGAQEEVEAIGASIVEEFPQAAAGRTYELVPLRQGQLMPASRAFVVPLSILLLAVVGTVLLTACVNVAHLQLARASRRQREIAVRFAMGANRARLLRQLLLESLVLAVLGGFAGLVIARLLIVYLAALPLPFELDLALDLRVLSFALAVALLTGVLFGLVPALRASSSKLVGDLQAAGPRAATGSGRWGKCLVVAQVAVSCCLLVLAGLFARSLVNLISSDPGFSPQRTLVSTIDPSLQGYKPEASGNFFDQLLLKVREMPGVDAASMVNALPGPMNDNVARVTFDGYTPPADEPQPLLNFNLVGTRYFETLEIPLLEGRVFGESDDVRAAPVLVLNREAADRYRALTGRPALGGRVSLDGPDGTWIEIIGVVANTRSLGLRTAPRPAYYAPHKQAIQSGVAGRMTLLVRTAGEPETLVAGVREAVRSLDPNLPLVSVGTLADHVADTLVPERLSTTLLLAAALLTLLLAAVGLYGVLSWSVAQRTAEIGVRMAVGAAAGDLVRWVVREGLVLVAIGIGVGVGLSAAATALASGFFFEVGRLDPTTWIGVFAVLAGAAFLASYLPARRATRVDPVVALRGE